MQAKEIFALGNRAYNGDREAGAEWFATLAPLARKAAKPYGVLPGIVLARAALESGWGSDLYEKVMERRFGVWLSGKAQNHNNLVGMVAYGGNASYAPDIPLPEWGAYRATFEDYGPHGDMGGDYSLSRETWKDYRSVEDCLEDFCAVLRSQAYRRGEIWPADLRGQLLSIGRGYTPEGAASEMGMDFGWQDRTLRLYEEYGLWKYDGRKEMEKADMKDLGRHIEAAYRFAHAKCGYGRTDTHYPPGETGVLDCVGLVYRAMYTMGRFPRMENIDQVGALCEAAGMARSTDEDDVWRRCGVACYQDAHLKGTAHVSHVFYSLGGTGRGDISKYDLGSNERIQANQPFRHVATNEWQGKRHFLCFFYVPDGKRGDEPPFVSLEEEPGVLVKKAGMYAGPGTAWRRLGHLPAGAEVTLRGAVTNTSGNVWQAVRYGKTEGYIFNGALKKKEPEKLTAEGMPDGKLSVRASPGGFRIAEMKAGESATVLGAAKAADGSGWLRVKYGKILGYVSGMYMKRK